MGAFIQDIRYGLRQLRRSPGFVAVAVATLALGIGSTTVVFSVVDAVLLHGTLYRNPSQLVEIITKNPQGEGKWVSGETSMIGSSLPQAFESLAAYKQWEFRVLTGSGEPDEVWTAPMSGNAFHLLGVNAVLGRTFTENETQAVVLSPAYWRSHFAADPKIIGRTLTLDTKPYTVVGVAPADFEFPDPHIQIWIPLTFTAAEKADHEHHTVNVIARLSAGSTLKQAQAALDVVTRRLALENPKDKRGMEFHRQALPSPGNRRQLPPGYPGLAGSGDLCAADCLREYDQHALRPRHNTARGDRHPRGLGRRPVEVDPATRGRRHIAGGRGHRCGPHLGVVGPRHRPEATTQVHPDRAGRLPDLA